MFLGVDPQGNQLPYNDEIRFTFYADESSKPRCSRWEIDRGRHIHSSYPVLKENENKANYRVVT